jgi:hypothetical protein
MNAQQLQQLRAQIMMRAQAPRAEVETLRASIDRIMADSARLTPEARRSDAARELSGGMTAISGMMDDARGVLEGGNAEVDGVLVRLTAVSDEDLQDAHRRLSVALSLAGQRPEILLNLYGQRHGDPADRRLIEEAALALADGLGDLDNFAFRDSWRTLQQELAASRGPEEAEALGIRLELEGLGSYLDASEELVGIDLTLLDPIPTPGVDRDQVVVQRALVEARVNEYESLHERALV